MGIDDTGIKSVGTNIEEVLKALIKEMSDDDSELLSVYYGNDVSDEEADKMKEIIENEFSDFEIEFNRGDQPVYYYILSLE